MDRILSSFMIIAIMSFLISPSPHHSQMSHDNSTRDMNPTTCISVNLTFMNGTPASGFTVELDALTGGGSVSNITDNAGRTALYPGPSFFGPGTIYAMDNSSTRRCRQEVYILPFHSQEFDFNVSGPSPLNISISGIVSDRKWDGIISGARVEVSGIDTFGNPFNLTDITTIDGAFHFDAPYADGGYHIEVLDMPSFHGTYLDIPLIPGRNDYSLELKLQPIIPEDSTILLRFTNNGSGTIDGDMLHISGTTSDMNHLPFDRSIPCQNETGWWKAEVPDGEYGITWYSGEPGENLTIDMSFQLVMNGSSIVKEFPLKLPELGNIEVSVRDVSGPIGNSSVTWPRREFLTDNGLLGMEGRAATDPSGVLTISYPLHGITTFSIEAEDHDRKVVLLDPTHSGKMDRLEVFLGISKNVSHDMVRANITVIDPGTGYAIPGASLELEGLYEGERFTRHFTTDSSGAFRGEIPAGHYINISAEHNIGFGKVSDMNAYPETGVNLTITLDRERLHPARGVHSSFNVLDDHGTPVHDVIVEISDDDAASRTFRTMSNKQGRVDLMLPPGRYCRRTSGIFDFFRQPFSSEDHIIVPDDGGELPDLLIIPNVPRITVEGHVMDEDTGEPIPWAEVMIVSTQTMGTEKKPLMNFSTHTDGTGFFRTYGCSDASIEVSVPGRFKERMTLDLKSSDGTENVFFRLETVPERTLWFNGTIVDRDGTPIRGEMMVHDIDHPWHILESVAVSEGEFSLLLYPGTFSITYWNETLCNDISVELSGPDPLEQNLVLRPFTTISGMVLNWSGFPVAGMNVSLLREYDDHAVFIRSATTSVEGEFLFTNVTRGEYELLVEENDNFLSETVWNISTDGWRPVHITITLRSRIHGSITGTVFTEGPPITGNINGSSVRLMNEEGAPVRTTITDQFGFFEFENVPFGEYSIAAFPPDTLSHVTGLRIGYGSSIVHNVVLHGARISVKLELPFVYEEDEILVKITMFNPTGINVSIDEPIYIEFERDMNRTTVEDSFVINPNITGISFVWIDNRSLSVYHDRFDPWTRYDARIGFSALSIEGFRTEGCSGMEWNFSTGNSSGAFSIWRSSVSFTPSGNLSVSLKGRTGQSIFLVIEDFSSFRIPEGSTPGFYFLEIPVKALVESSGIHNFHFSDSPGGEELIPLMSGTLTLPSAGSIPNGGEGDSGGTGSTDEEEQGLFSLRVLLMISLPILIFLMVLALIISRAVKGEKKEDDDWILEDWDDGRGPWEG